MSVTYVKNAAAAMILVGLCLMTLAVPAAALAPDPWKVYTYADQGFSASYPIEPKKTVEKNKTSFAAKVASGAIQYDVVVSDEPGAKPAKDTLDDITKSLGDKYKIKSQRDIELQGFPGRELVLEFESKGKDDTKGIPLVITNRIYIVKDHRYQTLVTSLKSKQEDAHAKKFLDSFKLIVDAPKP